MPSLRTIRCSAAGMDEPEARVLIEGAGLELADSELAELVLHTEGWPVGLYLAALALKSGGRRPTAGLRETSR